jgi:hypothetical protein
LRKRQLQLAAQQLTLHLSSPARFSTPKQIMPKKLRYTEEWKRNTSGRGPFVDVLSEFFRHQINPRAAILVAHGFIELLISTLVEAKCKNGKAIIASERDFSHSAKLVLLNEVGCLTNKRFRSLNLLRKIRNRAAHEPFFEITYNDLNICKWPANYEPSFDKSSPNERAKAFIQKLSFLFGAVWNDHTAIFSPFFGEKAKNDD